VSLAVRAPGKAILCGEYAVLHGAPAVAAAVGREVVARESAYAPAAPPFVAAARVHALRAGGAALGPIAIDSSALYDGERKLGVGSSAAVTTAVVGLSFARAHKPLNDPAAIFAIADQAHAEAQGKRGSGVDVACSVWGGTIRFVKRRGYGGEPSGARRGSSGEAVPSRMPATVEVTPADLPDGITLTFLWAGRSASTAELLGRVKALAEAAPARHDACIGRLISHAHAFATAVAGNDAPALLQAADAYHEAMAALGEAAGVDIVTEPHQRFAALARRHGGAAKPSGAGGGDLGVAFTVGPDATFAFREEAAAAGLSLLSLDAPALGLRLETT
jgi:phosphomevalonate kinase